MEEMTFFSWEDKVKNRKKKHVRNLVMTECWLLGVRDGRNSKASADITGFWS
jgi:hypothetical protein